MSTTNIPRASFSQMTDDEWRAMPDHNRGELLDAIKPDVDSIKERLTRGLCGRCIRSTIYERGHGEPVTHCKSVGQVVPNDITRCSAYEAPGQMSLWDMGKLAWIIDVRPNGGQYL